MTNQVVLIFHPQGSVCESLRQQLAGCGARVRCVSRFSELESVTRRWDPDVVMQPHFAPGYVDALPEVIGELSPNARQVLLVTAEEVEQTVAVKQVFEQLVIDPIPTAEQTGAVVRRALIASSPGGNILVVEDARVNLDMVADVMHTRGYRVFRATSAEDGLEIAHEMVLDAVLMDIYLPGMNGIDAVRALKQDSTTSSIPIVMLSANGSDDAVSEALDAGAIDFISKPFSPRGLLAKMDLVIEKKELLALA